jgi:hypothetical protein
VKDEKKQFAIMISILKDAIQFTEAIFDQCLSVAGFHRLLNKNQTIYARSCMVISNNSPTVPLMIFPKSLEPFIDVGGTINIGELQMLEFSFWCFKTLP